MKDFFTKKWIIENSLEVAKRYEKGILTIRALHYRLVATGITNDIQHYKRVINVMRQCHITPSAKIDINYDTEETHRISKHSLFTNSEYYLPCSLYSNALYNNIK
jgi:hypothetical protein